jgi:glycerate 2-kinase
MRFLLAPDSFKECMTAKDAALSMKEGIRRVHRDADVVMLPVGDGGEGTLDILTYATKGSFYEKVVTGPLGAPTRAKFSILGDGKTAVVEMAEASGLHLVPSDLRNPMITTSYGTGELIKASLDHEITHLIVTIGGSATNDCGAGMLQALGAKMLDDEGRQIGYGGGSLRGVSKIDLTEMDPRLKEIEISIACDVTNPLTGPKGASRIFGPQKGASSEMVEELDANLVHFADLLFRKTGMNVHDVPGSGAAGGLGAALIICGGVLKPGIDLVLDAIKFDESVHGVDFLFTGEGKIDSQTPDGKVIAGIVKRANKVNVPVIAFAGSVKPGYEALHQEGLLSVHSISQHPCSLEEALKNGRNHLTQTVENITRLLTYKNVGGKK